MAWSNHSPKISENNINSAAARDGFTSRRTLLTITTASLVALTTTPLDAASAKCTDIESCREIGERKDAENLKANPIVRLGGGLQFKVLRPGVGDQVVQESSKVNLIYSISQANGSYMYSRGFGYNKINVNGKQVSDADGLDSLTVTMNDEHSNSIPVGIQKSMIGMKRGERRRIECPPALGFETSNWQPEPSTFRGKQQVKDYKNTLYGRGSTQPPFPAPTIWDVEVLSIR